MTEKAKAAVIGELVKRVKQTEAELKAAQGKEERAELKGYLFGTMRTLEAIWQGDLDLDDQYISF